MAGPMSNDHQTTCNAAVSTCLTSLRTARSRRSVAWGKQSVSHRTQQTAVCCQGQMSAQPYS
eukprot:1140140-Pelagomonas_calceolata.AAC.1